MTRPPAVGPLPALAAPAPLAFRLANGLRVLAVPRRAAPIVAANLLIQSGSDADPPERAGLASLAAEMLDEGAGERGPLEIAEALDRLGADLGLGAGRDGSQLTLQVPAAEFNAALGIAADVVIRPRLDPKDWDRVRHDRLTALGQRRDQPEAVGDLVAMLTLFGADHPYGRPVDGLERSVGAITLDDVRGFHRRIWSPAHAVLALARDFDPEALPAVLEQAFGAWQPAPRPSLPAPPPRPALPRLVMVDRPGAPQSVLRMIGPGSSRHAPERAALSMLNVVLGGTFTSRLNFTLREKKGYTYGAGSSFGFFRHPAAFLARSSVFTEVTGPAVADALAEIGRMRSDDVTAEELTKARASLLGRTAEALSTASGTAATFGELGLYDLPTDEPARFVRTVMETDAAALTALAERYLDPEQLAIVVVGDRAVVEPQLRTLGLPAPIVRGPEGDLL
jgi:zinc protease